MKNKQTKIKLSKTSLWCKVHNYKQKVNIFEEFKLKWYQFLICKNKNQDEKLLKIN
jgi:hypothetical protein